MRRAGLSLIPLALLFGQAAPAAARDALGVFGSWGTFRDAPPGRCYAIAEPARQARRGAPWRPFAAISYWPQGGVRGQLHIRLRETKQRGARVYLTLGDRRFQLVAGRADAWAPDARIDAAIVAAMRSATGMRVETRSENGRPMTDVYRLRGAATAIDAAAVGCARPAA